MSNSISASRTRAYLGAAIAAAFAFTLALAFSPQAYASEASATAGIAAGKTAESATGLATQASASASSYALLTKSGYLCPCNSKGKKLASGWKGGSDKTPYKISKLFIASNVKKVPEKAKFVTVYSGGSKYTYTTYFGSSGKLKSVTFLLKNKKNACKSIADNTFSYATKLKSVTNFNKTKVTKIGERAFASSPLKTIALPKTLKVMGDNAFQSCKSLQTVSGLNKTALKSIPKSAFSNCYALKSVALPKTCKSVKDYAFQSCGKITKLTLGPKTVSLGNGAFNACASLKSVTLPASVKAIGSSCFSNCTDLTKLTMKSTTMVVNVENKSRSMSNSVFATPIYNKKAGAFIYVPASTLSAYCSADYSAPWNYIKDRFRAI